MVVMLEAYLVFGMVLERVVSMAVMKDALMENM